MKIEIRGNGREITEDEEKERVCVSRYLVKRKEDRERERGR